jgi:hypothetical protein
VVHYALYCTALHTIINTFQSVPPLVPFRSPVSRDGTLGVVDYPSGSFAGGYTYLYTERLYHTGPFTLLRGLCSTLKYMVAHHRIVSASGSSTASAVL